MKKSVKLLMLGLLAVGTLAGCNTNKKTSSDASSAAPASESSSKSSENPSSSEAPSSSEQPSSSEAPSSSEESSSSSSSEPEPPQPTRDWTEAEKELMEEHLHGIILPFFDVEGIALDYDDATEKFSIAGLAIEDGQIAEYAELYDAAEGWNDVSNQYGAWSSAPAGSFFVFERFVQTEEGKRGISVQFYGKDSSYTTAGPFYLYASDPFCYEFPDLAAEYSKYNVEGPNIPEPVTADLYYEFAPDSRNDLYHQYGYDSLLNATIYIYGLDEEAFMAYGLQCTLAGWTITEGEEEGEYNAVYVIEGEGTQYAATIFYSEDYVAISFDYLPKDLPVEGWDGAIAKANEILADHGYISMPYELPAIEGEGLEYEVEDWISGYGEVDLWISGDSITSSFVTSYGASLVEAGWTDLGSGYYEITTSEGIAKIKIGFSSTNGMYIYIFADLTPLPTAEWPAEAVAEMLGEEVTDVLPALDAELLPPDSYFQAFNDSYGMGVMVYLPAEETDIATYLEIYAGILTSGDDPFVYDGSKYYVSPNGQFYVYLYEGTDNNFVIELSLPVLFPSSSVQNALSKLLEIELAELDEVPALEGADSYYVYEGDTKIQIQCGTSSSSQQNALMSEYYAILVEEAGYSFAGMSSGGEYCFNSPNEQFYISMWAYNTSYVILDVFPGAFEPLPTEWPAEKVMSLLQGLDETITDVMPAFENGASYDAHYSEDDPYSDVKVIIAPGDGYTAQQLIAAFNAALEEDGFIKTDEDSYGSYYDSPNHQYNVCAWVSNSGSVIVDILLVD